MLLHTILYTNGLPIDLERGCLYTIAHPLYTIIRDCAKKVKGRLPAPESLSLASPLTPGAMPAIRLSRPPSSQRLARPSDRGAGNSLPASRRKWRRGKSRKAFPLHYAASAAVLPSPVVPTIWTSESLGNGLRCFKHSRALAGSVKNDTFSSSLRVAVTSFRQPYRAGPTMFPSAAGRARR